MVDRGSVDRGQWVDVGHGGGQDGRVSLSLGQGVLDESTGAHGQSSTVGVLLLVEGGGSKQSGNLVDSSLELTIVASLGLVSSNSHGHSLVSGNNLSVEGKGLDSRDNIWVGVVSNGVGQSIDQDLRISRPLAIDMVYQWSSIGGHQGSGASAQTHITGALLLLDSQSWDQAGHLMDGSSQVTIGASHSLVSTHRHWDRVASDHSMGGSVGPGQILGSCSGRTDCCQQDKGLHSPT